MTDNFSKILVLDIETNSLNIKTAKAVCVGLWTSTNDKYHCLWDKNKAEQMSIVRAAIKKADFVVTFNGKHFDSPVLLNGINKLFKYDSNIEKKHIDLYKVIRNKKAEFMVKFENGYGLDAVCKTFGLGEKIGDFDYKLFQKDHLTPEEKEEAEIYLRRDLELTKKLFYYLDDLYQVFTEFLPKYHAKKKLYLTSTTGSLAYSVICHMTGLPEKYNDKKDHQDYGGGLVIEPTQEEAWGCVRCVDYASAYPHAYMQGNLYTHCTHCDEYAQGNCPYLYTGGKTPEGHELKLVGKYCTKDGMGKIEKIIFKLFAMRLEAKKKMNDIRLPPEERDRNKKRQYAIKTIINTIYGISGSEKFDSVFDVDTAQDCTKTCRFNLLYLHWRLREAGYTVLYGDTDSAYLIDKFEDDNKLMTICAEIINDIKQMYPFPQDTFKVDLEEPIQYAKFFKDEHTGIFKKKKYILLHEDNSITVKGMQVIRSDSTLLTRNLWKTKIQPYIKENKSALISKKLLDEWIQEKLAEDITLAATQFKVKPFEEYSNPTQIWAQISKEFGEGIHFLVRNNLKIGVGKGVKYMTTEQAKALPLRAIDLTRTYSDLADFIKKSQTTFGDL